MPIYGGKIRYGKCTYSVHITIEDLGSEILYFKANKWLQLALEVFSSII